MYTIVYGVKAEVYTAFRGAEIASLRIYQKWNELEMKIKLQLMA